MRNRLENSKAAFGSKGTLAADLNTVSESAIVGDEAPIRSSRWNVHPYLPINADDLVGVGDLISAEELVDALSHQCLVILNLLAVSLILEQAPQILVAKLGCELGDLGVVAHLGL